MSEPEILQPGEATEAQMTAEAEDASTALAIQIPAAEQLAVLLRDEVKLDELLRQVEAAARAHVPDVSTEEGRKAIKSLAYRVSRTKTALDAESEKLLVDARKTVKEVNAGRKIIETRLDALRDETRKPITEWEAVETQRIDALKARYEALTVPDLQGKTAAEIKNALYAIQIVTIDETWQEYREEAERTQKAAAISLRAALADAEAREAERAELEELRREKQERAEADRLRAEKEAAEKAKAAQREADAAAAEREEKAAADRKARDEADKAAADAKAAQEAAEAAKAESERLAHEALEKAKAAETAAAQREADLAAQVAKAEEDRKAAEVEAERQKEAALQAERERIAAEAKAEEAAKAKRAANKKRREKARTQIVDALRLVDPGENPMGAIADALMAGQIPNCKVEF